jgi:enoyl-CoA hydratase/carnithine racemase
MSANLKQAREGRLLRLTLDRAPKRNALSTALCGEIVAAVEAAGGDRSVGAILLDAEGASFCAGMDLSEIEQPGAAERARVHEALFTMGARARKPIIAAVQGAALAGGTGLAANAHIVIAAENATFGLTEVRIGLWPYVIFRAVVHAVGERRAVELSLTGRIFGAADALAYGLVHEVVKASELDLRATAAASAIADASMETIARGLAFVAEARGLDPAAAGELAMRRRLENFAGADFAEGLRAFREKRLPRWPSLK